MRISLVVVILTDLAMDARQRKTPGVASSPADASLAALVEGGTLADRLDELMHPSTWRIHEIGVPDKLMDAEVHERDSPILISLDADAATRACWTASRAQHVAWHERARRGHAEGTLRALGAAHKLTLVCQRKGCGALVHMQAARRRARAAGRLTFAHGDGCGSRRCSKNFRPGQYVRNQLLMAMALEASTRHLAEWPLRLGARELWIQPASVTRATVCTALSCVASSEQTILSATLASGFKAAAAAAARGVAEPAALASALAAASIFAGDAASAGEPAAARLAAAAQLATTASTNTLAAASVAVCTLCHE